MRISRKLVLRSERLGELTVDDLRAVAAGDSDPSMLQSCLDIDCMSGVRCLSDRIAACDSYLRPCITHTCTR